MIMISKRFYVQDEVHSDSKVRLEIEQELSQLLRGVNSWNNVAIRTRRYLNAKVQTFIRKHRSFNNLHPCQYECPILDIESGLWPVFFHMRRLYPPGCLPHSVKQIIEHDAGSFILHSSNTVSVIHLTPYQDNDCRVFGEFKCNCGWEWRSAASWKNACQRCKVCNRKAFPHTQPDLNHFEEVKQECVSFDELVQVLGKLRVGK